MFKTAIFKPVQIFAAALALCTLTLSLSLLQPASATPGSGPLGKGLDLLEGDLPDGGEAEPESEAGVSLIPKLYKPSMPLTITLEDSGGPGDSFVATAVGHAGAKVVSITATGKGAETNVAPPDQVPNSSDGNTLQRRINFKVTAQEGFGLIDVVAVGRWSEQPESKRFEVRRTVRVGVPAPEPAVTWLPDRKGVRKGVMEPRIYSQQ